MTKISSQNKTAKIKSGTAPGRKKAQAKGPAGSKGDRIISLLRREGGASLADMMKATGWQQHSLRGFMSGTIFKRKGLAITSEKLDGERRYRIIEAGVES